MPPLLDGRVSTSLDAARSERFGDNALRLAGVAGALLGWRPEEFWRATPAELAAVLRAMMPEEGGVSAGEIARLMEMFPDG